jgi:hypothetical protein
MSKRVYYIKYREPHYIKKGLQNNTVGHVEVAEEPKTKSLRTRQGNWGSKIRKDVTNTAR